MEIIIAENDSEVANLAADYLAHYANQGGNLGVATGSTPLATYQELIRRNKAGELSFKNCSFFALDEYVGLPFDHEQATTA